MITLEDFEGDALEVLIERFTIGSESTKYAISYSDAYYASINNPGKIIKQKNFKLLYLLKKYQLFSRKILFSGYLDVAPNGTPFSTENLESCPDGYR